MFLKLPGLNITIVNFANYYYLYFKPHFTLNDGFDADENIHAYTKEHNFNMNKLFILKL